MRSAKIAITVAWLAGGFAACESSDVSREIGARCTAADDCDQRCLGPSDAYPGGFCSLTCDHDTDCPGGTRCGDIDGGVCLLTCAVNTDCAYLGAGWACKGVNLRGGGIKVTVCRG
jgi:hypothetical protein